MKNFYWFYFLFFSIFSYSQKSETGIELKSKFGFLIAHRPIMNHLPVEHTKSIEINYYIQASGRKEWHQVYKLPRFGASFLATTTGNKIVLGNHFGAMAFIDFPLLNKLKNKIYWKIACGIGYTNTIFNQETNPKNNAVSSIFNALINTSFLYQHRFKKSYLSFGVDLTHFSNGSVKLPNLGLNLPYLCFAYGRTISTKKEFLASEISTTPYIKKPWTFSLIGITSFKDYYPIGRKRKNVLALTMFTQKIFRHRVGYEAGFDFIYKPTIIDYKPVIYKSKESLFQLGFYNAYVVSLDKLQLLIGMGTYIKDEYFPDSRLYHRVGLRYTASEKIIFNLSLKSHWAKADYIEYGIGIKL
jgi:hypothetical protein